MSKRRSGLLSGLVIGLIATIVCTAGLGAAFVFTDGLPSSLRTVGDGVPLLAALAFVDGVLIGWAVRLVRPRSVLLSFVTLLYAAASVPGALVLTDVYLSATGHVRGTGAPYPPLDSQSFLNALPAAARAFWETLQLTWQLPTIMAAAALPAFALVLARALRLRRTGRHAAVADKTESEPEEKESPAAKAPEPEYRAPFEPVTPPKADPTATGSFFLPPDRREA